MSSGSAATRLVVLLVVVGAITVPGMAATDTTTTLQQVSSDGSDQQTRLLVELRANGDARWTISTTFDLSSANETMDYRELAELFENGETAELGLPSFQRANELADASTERSMEIQDISRSVAPERIVTNGTGRLTLSFTWTNFGQAKQEQLTIGDVFRTPEGQWLPGLEADQTLTIRPPNGYGVVNASVAPSDRELQWTGPASFTEGTLSATFTGAGVDPTPTADPNGESDLSGAIWLLLVVIGALAVVGYFVAKRESFELPTPGEDAPADDQPQEETSDERVSDAETSASQAEAVDTELLSDEERVERLLEQNGGRMKQADIVKETGWSNAKVSQLLSAMQEEDRIDKLRIGRENLISFPEEDVTDIEE